jgi:ferrous iron transport protein A
LTRVAFAENPVEGAVSLADLPPQLPARVLAVSAAESGLDAASLRRMAEIGFLPGEPVKILARVLGGDPLAVRVGNSTFALRRREALCVQVRVALPNE